jgi:resuscitation-promoting factor RpfB
MTTHRIRHIRIALLLLVLSVLAACQPAPQAPVITVSVVVDGRELTFQLDDTMTVDEFLQQADITFNDDLDRINPPPFTQISDGMRITIVRVTEEESCEREEIPYERDQQFNEGLEPGEERLLRVGQNGLQETCYQLIFNDGELADRVQLGQPTIIEQPVNEVIVVGLDANLEPIPVTGTLAYVNNGNAWVIKGNSTTKRPITTRGTLDGLVMSLTPDGRYLLYTADAQDEQAFVNELWVIETTGNNSPVQLVPTDVLYAEWIPNQQNVVSYSTGEVQDLFPGWKALNNVLTMRVDPQTGDALNVRQIVNESGGGYSGWWGTVYKWSPDGEKLAWSQASAVGIVDNQGELVPLLEFANFRTTLPWSWRPNLSWSWDSDLIATTVHGPPVGGEPPDRSPAFDVTVTDVSGSFEGKVVDKAGMWSSPQFSPPLEAPGSTFPQGYMAYLRARDPFSSVSGEYDLLVADRDGSNARVIFPPDGQAGIEAESQLTGLTSRDFAWSPDAEHIAVVYQGNIWMVEVATRVSYQLTFDGGSSVPVWSR